MSDDGPRTATTPAGVTRTATATGLARIHAAQQAALVADALGHEPKDK